MDFPLSKSLANRLDYLPEVDSSNLELARRLAPNWQEFSVLVAGAQTGGQGRMGRTWITGSNALAASVLLRPSPASASWITLLAGVALARALEELGLNPRIKWPNDVLLEGKKVSGILAQLQPAGEVVLGVGVNLETPVGAPEHATSLKDFGVIVSTDELLANFLAAFRSRYFVLQENLDFGIFKTKRELTELLATIGQQVRAEFPDGKIITGKAVGLDDFGQLILETPEPLKISAADLWHLRD